MFDLLKNPRLDKITLNILYFISKLFLRLEKPGAKGLIFVLIKPRDNFLSIKHRQRHNMLFCTLLSGTYILQIKRTLEFDLITLKKSVQFLLEDGYKMAIMSF
jgi:hypothetical protein